MECKKYNISPKDECIDYLLDHDSCKKCGWLIQKSYTKDEVIAMLTELQVEIEEQKRDELSYQQTWNYPLNVCVSIIQQKISELKGDHNHNGKT